MRCAPPTHVTAGGEGCRASANASPRHFAPLMCAVAALSLAAVPLAAGAPCATGQGNGTTAGLGTATITSLPDATGLLFPIGEFLPSVPSALGGTRWTILGHISEESVPAMLAAIPKGAGTPGATVEVNLRCSQSVVFCNIGITRDVTPGNIDGLSLCGVLNGTRYLAVEVGPIPATATPGALFGTPTPPEPTTTPPRVTYIEVVAGHASFVRPVEQHIVRKPGVLLPPIVVVTTDNSGNPGLPPQSNSGQHHVSLTCSPRGHDPTFRLIGSLTRLVVNGSVIFNELVAEGKVGICDFVFESDMFLLEPHRDDVRVSLELVPGDPHHIDIQLRSRDTQTEVLDHGAVTSVSSLSFLHFSLSAVDRGGNMLSITFCRKGGASGEANTSAPLLYISQFSEKSCVLLDLVWENTAVGLPQYDVGGVRDESILKSFTPNHGEFNMWIPDFQGKVILETRFHPSVSALLGVVSRASYSVVDRGSFRCIEANAGDSLSTDLANHLLDKSTMDEVSRSFFDLTVPPPPFVRFNISSLGAQSWYFNLPARHQYWVLMQSPFYIEIDPVLSEYFCFGFSYARVDDLNIYIKKPFCSTANQFQVVKELALLLFSLGDRSAQYHKTKGSQDGYPGLFNFTGYIPPLERLSVCVGNRILSPATTGYDIDCCSRETGVCTKNGDSHSLQTAMIIISIGLTTIIAGVHLGWIIRCLRGAFRLCSTFTDTEEVSQKVKIAFVHCICPVFPLFSVVVNYEYVKEGHPLMVLWSVQIGVIGMWYLACLSRLIPMRLKSSKRFYDLMVLVLGYISLWLLWAALLWSLPSIILETRRTLVPFVCFSTLLAHLILKPSLIANSHIASVGMFEVAVLDTQDQMLDSLIGTAVFAFFLTLLVYSLNSLSVVTDTQVILAIVVVLGVGFFMSWSLSGRLSAALRRTLGEVTEKVSSFVADMLARRGQQTEEKAEQAREMIEKTSYEINEEVRRKLIAVQDGLENVEKAANDNALVQTVGRLLSRGDTPRYDDETMPLQEGEYEEGEEEEDHEGYLDGDGDDPDGDGFLDYTQGGTDTRNASKQSSTVSPLNPLRTVSSDGGQAQYIPPSRADVDPGSALLRQQLSSNLSDTESTHKATDKSGRANRSPKYTSGFNSSGTLGGSRDKAGSPTGMRMRRPSRFQAFVDVAATVAENVMDTAGSPKGSPKTGPGSAMKRSPSFWGDPETQQLAQLVRAKSVTALHSILRNGAGGGGDASPESPFAMGPKGDAAGPSGPAAESPLRPVGSTSSKLTVSTPLAPNAGMSPHLHPTQSTRFCDTLSPVRVATPAGLYETDSRLSSAAFTKSPPMLFGAFADDVERLLGRDDAQFDASPPAAAAPATPAEPTPATPAASGGSPQLLTPVAQQQQQQQHEPQQESSVVLLRFDESQPLGFHLSKKGPLVLDRVYPGSVSEDRGLSKEIGRVLVAVNGEAVSCTQDVRRFTKRAGMRVEMTFAPPAPQTQPQPPPIPAALKPLQQKPVSPLPSMLRSPIDRPASVGSGVGSGVGSATLGSMPLSIDGPMLQTIEVDEPFRHHPAPCSEQSSTSEPHDDRAYDRSAITTASQLSNNDLTRGDKSSKSMGLLSNASDRGWCAGRSTAGGASSSQLPVTSSLGDERKSGKSVTLCDVMDRTRGSGGGSGGLGSGGLGSGGLDPPTSPQDTTPEAGSSSRDTPTQQQQPARPAARQRGEEKPGVHLSQHLLSAHQRAPLLAQGMLLRPQISTVSTVDDTDALYAGIPHVASRRCSALTTQSQASSDPMSVVVDPLPISPQSREALVGCLRKGGTPRSPEGRPAQARVSQELPSSNEELSVSLGPPKSSPRSQAATPRSTESITPREGGRLPSPMTRASSNVGMIISALRDSVAAPGSDAGGSLPSPGAGGAPVSLLPLTHLNSLRNNLESLPEMIDDTSDRVFNVIKEKSRAIGGQAGAGLARQGSVANMTGMSPDGWVEGGTWIGNKWVPPHKEKKALDRLDREERRNSSREMRRHNSEIRRAKEREREQVASAGKGATPKHAGLQVARSFRLLASDVLSVSMLDNGSRRGSGGSGGVPPSERSGSVSPRGFAWKRPAGERITPLPFDASPRRTPRQARPRLLSSHSVPANLALSQSQLSQLSSSHLA